MIAPRRSIVVVGSLNVDAVVRVERFPRPGETVIGASHTLYPGGKGGNQACAAARLGGAVEMVGQVGGDAHAAWLRDHLVRDGVDVTAVARDEAVSSGVATIQIDASGQNQIVIVPGANGTLSPERLRSTAADVMAGASIVLLQLEIPLDTVIEAAIAARRAGAVVILDPAPARAIPDALLAACDYVTPNELELAMLVGASHDGSLDAVAGAHALLARGARNVVVKLGAAGAVLVRRDHDTTPFPSFAVDAVDTTAAGDCWNGAFAVALAEGSSADRAGRFACAAAAISVTRAGAQPSLPTRAEVDALLARP